LEKQGMKRLVLDVRDNGGGIVDQAAQIAGEFLPKGAIVYTQEGRKADVADTGRVTRSFWSREKRYPVVLLVNRGSASASELLAGALQDHDRALVVGHTSFGKSLVMRGFPLPDGSYYVMVYGHVKTPCGRVIQRQYRGLTVREYRRRAGLERDVAGRPACRTDAGRVVYGGGGIYPDVVLPEPEPAPLWLARVREEAIPVEWIAGHLSASGGSYPSADALATNPTVAPATLASFRAFALEQGVDIPAGADADRFLMREIVLRVALAKFGEPGYYRVAASLDPEVAAAREAFGKAAELLAAGGER
jgi:carboxyl-terminal processing protease